VNTYMVVEIGVGDGYEVSSVREIDQPIIGVLANSLIARIIAVIDPNIGGKLNRSGIAVCRKNLSDLHVAHNDILLA
jgi:hypothetical protein